MADGAIRIKNMGTFRTLRLQLKQFTPLQQPLEFLERKARLARSRFGAKRSSGAEGLRLIRSGTVTVEAPDYLGVFTLDAQSHLFKRLVRHGSFEPACAAAVRNALPTNRDAIDVGANVGFFSVLFAKLLQPERRILAVEPVPGALKFLHQNLADNDVSRQVEVFEGAAGEAISKLSIELISGLEEYSSINLVHPSVSSREKRRIEVDVATVDSLVEARQLSPGFIKVDVEGSEVLVLRGAKVTIARFRPIILIEYAPQLLEGSGFSAAELLTTLRSFDYTIEWLSDTEILARPR